MHRLRRHLPGTEPQPGFADLGDHPAGGHLPEPDGRSQKAETAHRARPAGGAAGGAGDGLHRPAEKHPGAAFLPAGAGNRRRRKQTVLYAAVPGGNRKGAGPGVPGAAKKGLPGACPPGGGAAAAGGRPHADGGAGPAPGAGFPAGRGAFYSDDRGGKTAGRRGHSPGGAARPHSGHTGRGSQPAGRGRGDRRGKKLLHGRPKAG